MLLDYLLAFEQEEEELPGYSVGAASEPYKPEADKSFFGPEFFPGTETVENLRDFFREVQIAKSYPEPTLGTLEKVEEYLDQFPDEMLEQIWANVGEINIGANVEDKELKNILEYLLDRFGEVIIKEGFRCSTGKTSQLETINKVLDSSPAYDDNKQSGVPRGYINHAVVFSLERGFINVVSGPRSDDKFQNGVEVFPLVYEEFEEDGTRRVLFPELNFVADSRLPFTTKRATFWPMFIEVIEEDGVVRVERDAKSASRMWNEAFNKVYFHYLLHCAEKEYPKSEGAQCDIEKFVSMRAIRFKKKYLGEIFDDIQLILKDLVNMAVQRHHLFEFLDKVNGSGENEEFVTHCKLEIYSADIYLLNNTMKVLEDRLSGLNTFLQEIIRSRIINKGTKRDLAKLVNSKVEELKTAINVFNSLVEESELEFHQKANELEEVRNQYRESIQQTIGGSMDHNSLRVDKIACLAQIKTNSKSGLSRGIASAVESIGNCKGGLSRAR